MDPPPLFPPPPPWYKFFDEDSKIHTMQPPPLPTEGYPMFGAGQGNPLLISSTASRINPLDADRLFEEPVDININSDTTVPYATIFKDLLARLEERLLRLLDSTSWEGHTLPQRVGSIVAEINTLVKNMHYALNRLRDWEFLENVEGMLQKELDMRNHLISEVDAFLTKGTIELFCHDVKRSM